MSNKPRLLDLCSKAGGASTGYHQAGFEVTGVDKNYQKNYPFTFIQADALEYLAEHGHEYDVIAGSPPCQNHTSLKDLWGKDYSGEDILVPFRELVIATGKPYIIENVEGAPLINPLKLCGTMFGLAIERHRLFETNWGLAFAPAMCHHYLPVVKHGRPPTEGKHFVAATGHFSGVALVKKVMQIDWMNQEELAQAIPPAYTRYIGLQLMNYLEKAA
jgi:DNA (cytosine-5)-methyltransferase 1